MRRCLRPAMQDQTRAEHTAPTFGRGHQYEHRSDVSYDMPRQ